MKTVGPTKASQGALGNAVRLMHNHLISSLDCNARQAGEQVPWAAHHSGEQDTCAGSLRCAQEKQCMPRGTLGARSRTSAHPVREGSAFREKKKILASPFPPTSTIFRQRHSVNGMWASKPLGKHTQASASLPAPVAELHPQGPSSP